MMSTKTVALDEEAYEALRRAKRPDESFSDVVKRMAGRRRPLTDFAGIWKDMPEEDFRQIEGFIKQGRELDRKRMERLLKE